MEVLEAESPGLKSQQTYCVTLGKSLNLSELPFLTYSGEIEHNSSPSTPRKDSFQDTSSFWHLVGA